MNAKTEDFIGDHFGGKSLLTLHVDKYNAGGVPGCLVMVKRRRSFEILIVSLNLYIFILNNKATMHFWGLFLTLFQGGSFQTTFVDQCLDHYIEFTRKIHDVIAFGV